MHALTPCEGTGYNLQAAQGNKTLGLRVSVGVAIRHFKCLGSWGGEIFVEKFGRYTLP